MNTIITKLPAALLTGILILLAVYSCKKDPYQIGVDLLPPTDTLNVKTTDTCLVQAFSVRQDSIRTDKSGSLHIGSIADPVFGKITSSVYTQLLLESEGVDFGTHPVLDSLVLMLGYTGHYGDTLTPQNIKVYEISETFSYDSIYYSNKTLKTYPTLLADRDFVPKLSDSVSLFGKKVGPHLRINMSKLSNYLGNKILYAPSTALASNTAFLAYMKGLYIQATPAGNKGSMLNFSITNGLSELVAYYHNGNDPANDSLQYSLLINSSCARFTHVDHNGYIDASQDLKQQVLNHDSAKGAGQLYLQGMAGVKVKVKFPYMRNFGLGRSVAINEAILELKNLETDTSLAPPATLIMLRQDSIGRISYLPDYSEGTGYFGGTYNRSSRTYNFRITEFMQKVIQNGYSGHFDLYILVDNPITSVPSPNRIVLNGTKPLLPGDNSGRLRLKVTYTILH